MLVSRKLQETYVINSTLMSSFITKEHLGWHIACACINQPVSVRWKPQSRYVEHC